jgi:hypothetical protein
MPAPRFRLRSLVLLIVFLAMAMTIAILTVQNQRLHAITRMSQMRADAERRRAEAALAQALQARDAMRQVQAKQATGGN